MQAGQDRRDQRDRAPVRRPPPPLYPATCWSASRCESGRERRRDDEPEPRETIMTRHVEIAGGGFTGLTMGTALAQAGWTARVHERTEDIRAFGAGIWIWDNGVRVLKAIGAADDALEGCTDVPTYISHDAKGRYHRRGAVRTDHQHRSITLVLHHPPAAPEPRSWVRLGAPASRSSPALRRQAGEARRHAHYRWRARVAGRPGHRRRRDQLQRARFARPAEEPQAPRGWRHPRPRAARAGLCGHRRGPHHPRMVERLPAGALHAVQPRGLLSLLLHAGA